MGTYQVCLARAVRTACTLKDVAKARYYRMNLPGTRQALSGCVRYGITEDELRAAP